MPIYEYACEDCEKQFEVFLGVHDAPVEACAHCASKNIRKLISNCSFQLKGTGWYVTDYARKNSGSDSSNGRSASAKESGGTAKSETSEGGSEAAKPAENKKTEKSASPEKAA